VASDGHTRARAERPVAIYIPATDYFWNLFIFIFLLFRLWLALYGAGVPPEPSGQAEAEQVR
jgi:hypothetical protein